MALPWRNTESGVKDDMGERKRARFLLRFMCGYMKGREKRGRAGVCLCLGAGVGRGGGLCIHSRPKGK